MGDKKFSHPYSVRLRVRGRYHDHRRIRALRMRTKFFEDLCSVCLRKIQIEEDHIRAWHLAGLAHVSREIGRLASFNSAGRDAPLKVTPALVLRIERDLGRSEIPATN